MMKTNDSLADIISEMKKAESILFLTHVTMDGDTAGSAAALCRAMLSLGKTAHIYTGESFPLNLKFLDFEGFIREHSMLLEEYDLVMTVDCSDMSRFDKRMDLYNRGKLSVNIDHHATNDYYADLNYVEADAPAAGEIVYKLIRESGIEADVKTAEALYTAIVTDTGQFQYNTTTSGTHRIAAELLEAGIDLNYISVNLFQTVRKESYILRAKVLETMEFLENDRFVIAFADRNMFNETGCMPEDSDGISELLRNIESVEVSSMAKEISDGVYKISFRSKNDIDVSKLASGFGGGGHRKASGCTIRGNREKVKALLYPEVTKLFMSSDL